MQLEFRHLRTLCAIAVAGSLTKAAAVLGVSQPALSAQVRRIETLLGGPVFERSRLGVAPTAFGEFVIARGRTALMNLDELTAGAGHDAGTARFGGVSGPALVTVLEGLRTLLPATRITVQTEHSPRLVHDLLAGRRVDAAALIDYPGRELPALSGIGSRVVAVEPVFVALPADHRLAAGETVPLEELAAEPCVLPPPDGSGWPETFLDACEQAGFTPDVPHRMAEPSALCELIVAGGVIAPCRATFRDRTGVVVRPLAGDPLWLRHVVAWRDDGPFAPAAEELCRIAARAQADAAGGRPHYARWLARRPGPHNAR
ncbi:LysR family transcriptional regulator [Actinomadura sp. HBU206391]|uniref:LysR family transcriptional regulator n=1 Tax=Actinomadura sp. HBU206391 TaxID=2731692 RepID=UPI0016502836|nr:LysR family transcriptional regulator [Actinomadura sp. HBU206391]MBC6463177.1 LysR family transcriptional regulator [Actinomadura sp. HBU206391]